jgi:hypothetical protein
VYLAINDVKSCIVDAKEVMRVAVAVVLEVKEVGRWRDRYRELGVVGIEKGAQRPGRRKKSLHGR